MTEAKAKYQYMDVARGLALLLVMISHAHGLSSFLIFYYIQIFFIISGYIYKPGRSYGDNIRRKAKRLLVPYFGYSALLWCAYALIRRDMGEMKQSLFGIFYSRFCLYKNATHTENVYLLDIANGAMWYLSAVLSDRRQVSCKCKDNGGHIGRACCRDDGIKRTAHSSSVEYGYCAGCGTAHAGGSVDAQI